MNSSNVQKSTSDLKFSQAISRGFYEELTGWFTRRSRRLIPFEEVKEKLDLWFVTDIGIQTVRLDAIIGSQGRYQNFTRHFFPKDESLRNRWKDIDGVLASGKTLPPVTLYKVCEAYFVKDGHHRISVARAKKQDAIEAKIYEYDCDVSLDDKTDIKQLAILETYHKFLKETGLKKQRKVDFHVTVLGGYTFLMEHIQRHGFYMSEQENRRIPMEEAARSWYDKIYAPLVDLIAKNGIMASFPHRTETDFYIWIVNYRKKQRREMINEDILQEDEAKSLIDAYARKYAGWFKKMLGRIKRWLGLVDYQ